MRRHEPDDHDGRMTDLSERLPELLQDLSSTYDVPGSQLAVLTQAGVLDTAHGVLSTRTKVEATTDAAFQMGSITKVWTTTLAMQLVDEGLLDLDAPVVSYLPGFRVASDELTVAVTPRHLMNHTSGIDGDLFLDTGRGDDAVARYVDAMSELPALHPLGAMMSYCNSGFSLLGHLVATLRGTTWEQVLRDRLVEPLGLTVTGALPEDALRHRAAIGHSGGEPVPTWGMSRSSGPAGADVHTSARELLAFAKLHLDSGVTQDGTRLLSEASVTAMQTPHIGVPAPFGKGSHWGLGWHLDTWGDQRVIGHSGATLGQQAFLRAFPDAGTAIAVMTNGGNALEMFEALLAELAPELAGVGPRRSPVPHDGPLPDSASRRIGTYARTGQSFEVRQEGDGLVLVATSTTPEADGSPPHSAPLRHVQDDEWAVLMPPMTVWFPVAFVDLPDGSSYLHLGARATPKAQP
jgi:CubicO group peptidase (beta-lactamase class C family)